MPLVYEGALKRRDKIANNKHLRELEISGFVKCIARGKCCDDITLKKRRIEVHAESLIKQFEDFKNTLSNEVIPIPINSIRTKEALADIRNVAGLLFDELDNEE